eukprot:COSAG02_NODE_1320_length_13269_cov_11.420058_5_plen_101_part_00
MLFHAELPEPETPKTIFQYGTAADKHRNPVHRHRENAGRILRGCTSCIHSTAEYARALTFMHLAAPSPTYYLLILVNRACVHGIRDRFDRARAPGAAVFR